MKKITLLLLSLAFSISLKAQLAMSEGARKLATTMAIIENLYVDPVDDKKLSEDAIRSLLEKLDPHSTYISAEEVKDMNEPLEGNFDGIGISFNMMADTLYVIETIAGGPSEKVGLRAGDRIIYADTVKIAGMKKKNKEIMSLLKGPKGTTVEVKILRRGEPQLLTFKITRAKIPIYSLDAAYMMDKQVGYIRLSRFGATTTSEFIEACNKLKLQGMVSLILDLEGNGGGYLGTAIELADEFLTKGKLIVYTEGTKQPKQVSNSSIKGDFEKGKLVVLIDGTSASASEIVAGAVQDWDRGVVVGRRSFGKGLVQRQVPLPDQSQMRLTVARYFTPSGRCIQRPYTSGDTDSYNTEFVDRYNKGELMHADSIHFPDSLKYKTIVNKRTVYGGGGIMPDFYVPLDTTLYPMYFRSMSGRGVIYKFAFNEVDLNREQLLAKSPTADDYIRDFEVDDDMMKRLIALGEEEKVKFNEEEYNRSKDLMANYLKSYIARDLYNTEAQVKVWNKRSEIVKKGYEIICDNRLYESLLKGK